MKCIVRRVYGKIYTIESQMILFENKGLSKLFSFSDVLKIIINNLVIKVDFNTKSSHN